MSISLCLTTIYTYIIYHTEHYTIPYIVYRNAIELISQCMHMEILSRVAWTMSRQNYIFIGNITGRVIYSALRGDCSALFYYKREKTFRNVIFDNNGRGISVM